MLLIPVVIGYGTAFYEQLLNVRQIREPELSLLLGIASYLAFHALVGVPTRVYVFGHELMHAVATWISGGRVRAFKVGSRKGSVTADRLTALAALFPYLVPVYSVLWAALYGLARLWVRELVWDFLFFGLGVTLTFHLVFTVNTLKQQQTDLEMTGPLLALDLIVWGNMTLVVLVMALAIPEVRLAPYLAGGFQHTFVLFQGIFHQLFIR